MANESKTHHEHAQAPPIGGHRVPATVHHFGRHVLDCATEAVGDLAWLVQRFFAESEVGQIDVALGIEKNARKQIFFKF